MASAGSVSEAAAQAAGFDAGSAKALVEAFRAVDTDKSNSIDQEEVRFFQQTGLSGSVHARWAQCCWEGGCVCALCHTLTRQPAAGRAAATPAPALSKLTAGRFGLQVRCLLLLSTLSYTIVFPLHLTLPSSIPASLRSLLCSSLLVMSWMLLRLASSWMRLIPIGMVLWSSLSS